jgi:tetratricopeptide (TPR) repeat protein
VFAIIPKIWDWHYPIGETQDLAFDLGLLLYQLDFYEAALGYFKLSLEEYGESATVYYNLGLCYYLLKRNKDSLLYLDMCLKLDPGHDGALSIHKNMKHKKRRVT